MIAASAPMLKPLVGKVLGLETRSDGAYYQYGSRNTNVNHRGNANAMRSNVHDRAFGRAEAGYELEDRETDSDGASGVSAQKGEESMSGGNALYRHEMGSQDKILHYSAYRTTVENGLSRPSPHNKSSFQGITRTTEVTVE
ncbi:hypothetical protein BX600DRAFT_62507 [Xylariales sp. PMI_506]|nr:hypothetical protein BX600DRAFT_62507 [Xylariales sp. PMI_506]